MLKLVILMCYCLSTATSELIHVDVRNNSDLNNILVPLDINQLWECFTKKCVLRKELLSLCCDEDDFLQSSCPPPNITKTNEIGSSYCEKLSIFDKRHLQIENVYNIFCVFSMTSTYITVCIKSNYSNSENIDNITLSNRFEEPIDYEKDKIDATSGVRKCCNENEIMLSKSCYEMGNDSISRFKSKLQTVANTTKYFFKYLTCDINQERVSIDDFFIHNNGSMFWESGDYNIDVDSYCVEIFSDDEIKYSFQALVCVSEDEITDSDDTPLWGMIISMPFLLATFIVYLLLPERNLHRRALMSYVFTLLAAYITLVTIQLNSAQYTTVLCHILGYSVIFFFLVSFFWMNVMCVDMWLAFSGMKTVLSKKTAERKRFIIYCVYAWGVPILHVLLVFLLNTYLDPKSKFHPEIGVSKCFLGGEMRIFYYFYMPMTVLIGINIVLFILTTIRIQKVRKETSMLKQSDSRRHTYDDDKQQFNLYLKLMFAMGMNWIMEIVSWAVGYIVTDVPPFVWYLTDFTNAMYGVVIFLLFVFKKKIWRSLKKRYYVCIGKPHLAHSMTTSSARTTRTSNYSTTETGVSNDIRLTEMKNGRTPEESALNRQ